MNLDEYDLKIIDLLARDSRMSYSQIGRILGLTRQTVKSRISRLEEEGIIERYTVKVSLKSNRPVFFLKLRSDGKPEGFSEIYRIGKDRYLVKLESEGDQDIVRIATMYDIEEIIPVVEHFESETPGIPKINFRCDYCGKEAFDKPHTYRLHNKLYVFCCPTCLELFREANYHG